MSGRTVPKGWLRGASGVFSLAHSDTTCGSYISREDAARILLIEESDLPQELKSITIDGDVYFSDKTLGRAWATKQLPGPRNDLRAGGLAVSFDELILITLIEDSLPNAEIDPQPKVGRYTPDLIVSLNGDTKIIEFLGPYHFIRREKWKKPLKSPLTKKQNLEAISGNEAVLWPYWVQRCRSNVRRLFDEKFNGIGSIWSTSALFGDFDNPQAANIIKEINERFSISRKDGVGYMYTSELVSKPVHPIVGRIRKGKDPVERLIPPGSNEDSKYWIPRELWPVL